jgi:alpha-galactosidase
MERGPEFASYIMEAMATGTPAVVYGNVLNAGLIDSLPHDGVVEVPCLVDKKGVQPTRLAAINAQHMAFHDQAVTAALEQDREAAVHALMLDPLTAAVCSLAEARQIFDEMVQAECGDLPEFLL